MHETVVGRSGAQVDLAYGTAACPAAAPFIAASEVGFSPLGGELGNSPAKPAVKRVANAMRDAEDGLWLALCDLPRANRRLALIQSNRRWSPGARNFYQRHHTDTGRVWRDFYYTATHTILKLIDDTWSAEEVILSHPTGHAWPRDLLPTVLEAIGHHVDGGRPSSLRRVCIHPCCLDGPEPIRAAISVLNTEQSRAEPPRHRPIRVHEEQASRLGLAEQAGVRLFRAELPNQST